MNTVTLTNGDQAASFQTRGIFYCRWNGHETSCLVSEACAVSKMERLIAEMKNPAFVKPGQYSSDPRKP